MLQVNEKGFQRSLVQDNVFKHFNESLPHPKHHIQGKGTEKEKKKKKKKKKKKEEKSTDVFPNPLKKFLIPARVT